MATGVAPINSKAGAILLFFVGTMSQLSPQEIESRRAAAKMEFDSLSLPNKVHRVLELISIYTERKERAALELAYYKRLPDSETKTQDIEDTTSRLQKDEAQLAKFRALLSALTDGQDPKDYNGGKNTTEGRAQERRIQEIEDMMGVHSLRLRIE